MGSWSPVAGTFLAPALVLGLGLTLAACAPAERPEPSEPAEEWSPRIDLETDRDGGAALPEVGSPLATLPPARRSFAPISASPSGLPPRTTPAAPRSGLVAGHPAASLPAFGDRPPAFPPATWPMPIEPTPAGAAPALHAPLLLRPPGSAPRALSPLLPPSVLVPVVVSPAVAPTDPDRAADPGPDRQVVRASMREMAFVPARIEITAGTTVIWTNRDQVAHTVTARDRSWDSGLLQPGASWRRTFSTPGTYSFFCLPHPEMTGTVVVKPRG